MQRSAPLAARLLGLLALLLCGGCDVQFPQQEVRFRYDAETDTLDVLMIYRGVHAPTDDDRALAKGVDVVDRILAGRREFMVMNWPLYFDLDEELPEGQSLPENVQAVVDRVSVRRVGAFLDEYDRLCGYQHLRLEEVTPTLAEANRVLHEGARQALEAGQFVEGTSPCYDAEGVRLWTEFLDAGTPWLELDAGRILVRAPLSRGGAARGLEEFAVDLLGLADKGDVAFVMWALENLTGMRLDDGLAEFWLGAVEGDETVLRFEVPNMSTDQTYSPALRDLVVERGLDLSGAPTLDEVRGMLGD